MGDLCKLQVDIYFESNKQFILMEDRNQVRWNWATHYKFFKFGPFSEHWVLKQNISTWFELKRELSDHVIIEPDRINIAINNKLAFYQPDTLLEDIDIKKDDICFVMARKENLDPFLADKQEEQKQRNMNEISRKRNDKLYKKPYEDMKGSKEKQALYKKIVKQYSKWECLIALKESSKQDEVRTYLNTGKAKQFIERMQRAQIDKIIDQNDKIIRKQLKEDNSPQNYGSIMKGLDEQYVGFNKLELNHQKYLQEKLLRRELMPPRDINLQKKIASSVEQSNKQRIRYQQSMNNLQRLPEQRSLSSIHELNQNAKINLIIQFFTHPSFDAIIPKLKGDKQKCRKFLQLIKQKYATHKQLNDLIEQYKMEVIKVLSEGEPMVNEEEYYAFYQFTQGLTRSGFGKTEAIKLAKASQNSLQKLKIFLEAGGIIKTFKLGIIQQQA